MAGFGYGVGDILACGKLCYQIYKACFSESGDSIASWSYLGRELLALGTALKSLSWDDNIIPSHMYIEGDQEQSQKEQRALEAVRMVVGDFKETLRELEAMLLKYDDFRTSGGHGAKLYWLKVKYSVNSGDLDKFRTRIAMHTRAVNLLLNPLIYEQMKGMQTSQQNIQTSVSNIHTRIDTIDQVLHALLFVASEQLTSATPRIPSSSRISTVRFNDGFLPPKNQRLLEGNPMNVQTIPSLLAGANSGVSGRPIKSEKMARSTSHPPEFQSIQSSRLESPSGVDIRRRTTEPHDGVQPSSFHKTSTTKSDRKKHDSSSHKDHEDRDSKRKGKGKQPLNGGQGSTFAPPPQSSKTLNYPSPKSQRKASVDSVEASENPNIDAALRKQAESNEAQYIPIEHWITAAMHWYFKANQAESELDEDTESYEVSLEAYLGLMKSTWIVENVIRQWDSETELPPEIRINVETLIVSIVDKFRKMESRKMPDVRKLKTQDFEIWHEDIKGILAKPISPLGSSTHSISRESTIKRPPLSAREERPPRERSVSLTRSIASDIYPRRISVTSPEPDHESSVKSSGTSLRPAPRIGELELGDMDHWQDIFELGSSSRRDSVATGRREPSPGQDTFYEWPSSGRTGPERAPHASPVGGLPESSGSSFPKYNDPVFRRASYGVQRSPSVSTSSTNSSGRRESLNSIQYPNPNRSSSAAVPIPIQKKPLPPIIRKPVPSGGLSVAGLNISGFDQRSRHSSISEVDESEFVEMIGERLVLDTIPVLWASRSAGPFTTGSLKIFWHQSHEYFRLFTTWGGGRSDSRDIPLRSIELVPAYAYEEEPILFLRKANQRSSAPSSLAGTSPSTGNELSRKGYVYKFYSSEEMLKFQTALTGEDVYQDLVKRVSAVKFKRSTEKGGHTYHNARLQLWHEKPPSDSLLPDTASGRTGMSQATRIKLSLQWSRLVIYLEGSDCFITCFVTDDITLKRDENKLSLVPTKYSAKDVLFKSPRSVKAVLAGGDHAKGGFRLDKDRISWNDEHSFEDFSYIQITFKEALYLNKFETLWNQMMDTRRSNRIRINSLQKEIERRTYAPGYET